MVTFVGLEVPSSLAFTDSTDVTAADSAGNLKEHYTLEGDTSIGRELAAIGTRRAQSPATHANSLFSLSRLAPLLTGVYLTGVLYFFRLERNAYWVMGSLFCYPPLIEHWRDGKYAGVNSGPMLAEEFFKGRSTWLKLQRQGERMTASLSHNGNEWIVAKEFKIDFPEDVSVGVQALNTSNAPFTVEFEEFQLERQEGSDKNGDTGVEQSKSPSSE